jgi:hypothetical protein
MPPRLAKSTLTLIPLLGTHEVIFAFVMDEHARGTLRFIKLFTELSFTSFQVTHRWHGCMGHPSLGEGQTLTCITRTGRRKQAELGGSGPCLGPHGQGRVRVSIPWCPDTYTDRTQFWGTGI